MKSLSPSNALSTNITRKVGAFVNKPTTQVREGAEPSHQPLRQQTYRCAPHASTERYLDNLHRHVRQVLPLPKPIRASGWIN